MNAYRGHPLGDVVRSYLMLKSPFNPLPIHGLRRLGFMTYKSWAAELFLSRSLKRLNVKRGRIRPWVALIAAVRLCDNVPGEREWLLRLIERNI
jgi:hypothetical protein